ncbi:hypothetical protein Hanom_Chr07g00639121 [Helianthus anomalus]
MSGFESWTRIDLCALYYAAFYNLDSDERGWDFLKRLEYEVLNEFLNLETAEYCERWHREVIETTTGKQVRSVIWPLTTKAKIIPLFEYFLDGSLKDFEFWCYDPKIGDVVMVCKDKEYRVAIPSDLMRFAKEDITLLSKNQIRCDSKYEVSAKYYTCGVAM